MVLDLFSVHHEGPLQSVLVFGPESVSYERSRRETAAKFHDFLARVFFVQIPKCQDSMIYAIFRFFRILFLQYVLVPKCPCRLGRALAQPGHIWTRTFFRYNILKKLNIAYIIESWHFGIWTKKTRAEKLWNLVRFSRRDLSYETDSGPKTETASGVYSGQTVIVSCIITLICLNSS